MIRSIAIAAATVALLVATCPAQADDTGLHNTELTALGPIGIPGSESIDVLMAQEVPRENGGKSTAHEYYYFYTAPGLTQQVSVTLTNNDPALTSEPIDFEILGEIATDDQDSVVPEQSASVEPGQSATLALGLFGGTRYLVSVQKSGSGCPRISGPLTINSAYALTIGPPGTLAENSSPDACTQARQALARSTAGYQKVQRESNAAFHKMYRVNQPGSGAKGSVRRRLARRVRRLDRRLAAVSQRLVVDRARIRQVCGD